MICLLDVPEVMRCMLLCILEAVEGELCLLTALEVLEVMRRVRICMPEAAEGEFFCRRCRRCRR